MNWLEEKFLTFRAEKMRKTTKLAIQVICVAFCCGVIFQSSVYAGNVPWRTDVRAAAKESAQTKKPMLLKITADWCYYCKKMKKSFEQEKVAKQVNDCFVPVIIDADKHQKLVAAIGIDGLPTTVIITSDYKVLKKITGYKDAKALGRELDKICQVNHIKPVVSQQRETLVMQEKFVPQQPAPLARPRIAAPRVGSINQFEQAKETIPTPPVKTKQVASLEDPFQQTDENPFKQMESSEKKADPTSELSVPQNPFAQNNSDFGTGGINVKPTLPINPAQQLIDVKQKYAFAGLCLVSLLDERYLTEGTAKFTAQHRGKTLCFASKEYKEIFEKNPEKYWPVLDGACVVSQLDKNIKQQGDPETGAVFRGKLWFFKNVELRQQFANSPQDYAKALRQ